MGRCSTILWILLYWVICEAGADLLIQGRVRDDDTREPLPGATLEIEGTGKGTAAGEGGRFTLRIAELPVVIRVSHIGFDPQELVVEREDEREFEIFLTPVVYEMEGVTVAYQDPAVRIMREVIRRKREWWLELNSYTAKSYTRQALYSDNEVAGIRESIARIYHDRRRGRREVVHALRNTREVPREMQAFSGADYAVNLYDDWVDVLGNRIMGVTHPKGLRNYRFQVTEEKEEKGLVTISVAPRPGQAHAFVGYLVVDAERYALVEAALEVVPPVQWEVLTSERGIGFFYREEFERYEPGVWLPAVLHYEIDARFGTSVMEERVKRLRGVPTPRARLQGSMRTDEYSVGVEIPELFFMGEKKLKVDPDSWRNVELFDEYDEELFHPMREQRAFQRRERRPPSIGPVAALFELYGKRLVRRELPVHQVDPMAEGSPVRDEVVSSVVAAATGLDVGEIADRRYVPEPGYELWFNRVDGAHLVLTGKSRPHPRLALYMKGGYDTGTEKPVYGLGFRQGLGKESRGFTGISYQAGTRPRYASENYSLTLNSLPMLLSLDDYFDYYRSRRTNAEVGYRLADRGVTLRLGLNQEEDRSLSKQTDFDLVCGFQHKNGRVYELFCDGRDDPQRPNPPVDEGRLRSVELLFNWGGEYRPFGTLAQKRVELAVEHAGDWLGGDFSFNRYRLSCDWHAGSLLRKWGLAEEVLVHGLAIGASGDLPVQRHGALDSGIWLFRPSGTFRSGGGLPYEGEDLAALFWEVDLGGRPFERLMLKGLAEWGFGLALHGASGRVWNESISQGTDESMHEIGMSLVLQPLRLEMVRRIEGGGWRFGFSLARGAD